MSEESNFKQLNRIAENVSAQEDLGLIRESLEAEGVDVDEYLKKMSKVFRTEFQSALKKAKRPVGERLNQGLQDLGSWGREQLEEYLEKAKQGLLGEQAESMAAACYRNKSGEELADAELRSLVEDIINYTM